MPISFLKCKKHETKIGTEKRKEICYKYFQKTCKIFVHDSPDQKQSFLILVICYIHGPSQL